MNICFRIFDKVGRMGMLDWMPDKQYLSIMYRGFMGKKLNVIKPATFNEKIQWLKLHDRKPEYTTMVDKYAVKKYVEQILGGGKNTLFLHLVFGMNLMILISLHYQIALC